MENAENKKDFNVTFALCNQEVAHSIPGWYKHCHVLASYYVHPDLIKTNRSWCIRSNVITINYYIIHIQFITVNNMIILCL